MPDISSFQVEGTLYDLKDAIARGKIGDLTALGTEAQDDLVAAINELLDKLSGVGGITFIESTDTANPVVLRDLASGAYVLYGRYIPYTGSTRTLTFSSNLLVNIIKSSSTSHVQVFYPANNVVQFLNITDSTYERTDIKLNDLNEAVSTLETSVGDLSALETNAKTDLVSAINEAAQSGGSGVTIDNTLSQEGQAADAAAVGESLKNMAISGLTTAQIDALDALFRLAAYTGDAEDAYAAFRAAFVRIIPATGITLSATTISFASYETYTIIATVEPADTTDTVVWSSSNEEVATVKNGVVTPVAGGDCVITATAGSVSAECSVSVAENLEVITYNVTNNLTNVTNNNSDTTASGYYSAKLSAPDGYDMTVAITMGGVDVTEDVYSADGSILITTVTGDIVITATAQLRAYDKFYELLHTPVTANADVYEDTGLTFGSSAANGYTKAWTLCVDFDVSTYSKYMYGVNASSKKCMDATTNGAGSLLLYSCSAQPGTAIPSISDGKRYRYVITHEANSDKVVNVYCINNGEILQQQLSATYGSFTNSVYAGNLYVGGSTAAAFVGTINEFTIYDGVLSGAHISAFLEEV